jgi:hypothetical protein
MEKLILNLQFLFMPKFWIMNNNYNEEWDIKLNQLMDKFEPVFGRINPYDGKIYNVSFDGNSLWVQNYPYAYATPVFQDALGQIKIRPSRLTILRLYNLINERQKELEIEGGEIGSYFKKIDESLSK